MTVGDFKKWICQNDVPDDMPIILIDTTTDDTHDMNYFLDVKESLEIGDTYPIDGTEEDYAEAGVEFGEPTGKAVMIFFENRLNENPINL